MKKIYLILLMVVFLGSSLLAQSYDYKTMTMDQYKVELQKWQDTEAKTKAEIEKEKAKIEELKKQKAFVQHSRRNLQKYEGTEIL